MCFSPAVGYEIIVQESLFNLLKSLLYDACMGLCDYRFYQLIPPVRLFRSVQSFSFELKRSNIRILCW